MILGSIVWLLTEPFTVSQAYVRPVSRRRKFAERLLQEEHVACVAGDAFGPCGDGHVRMCYAVPTADIEVALERIANFVSRVRA